MTLKTSLSGKILSSFGKSLTLWCITAERWHASYVDPCTNRRPEPVGSAGSENPDLSALNVTELSYSHLFEKGHTSFLWALS